MAHNNTEMFPRDLEMVLRDLEEVPRDGLALIWCYMGLPVITLQPLLQLCPVPLSSSNNSNHTAVGLDLFQLFVLKILWQAPFIMNFHLQP